MRASRLGLTIAVSLGLAACASSGSQAPHPDPDWAGRFAAWEETDPAYRFFPGDSIVVTVHSAPELSTTTPIGPDGRVSLPLLGNVMVANRTDYEIAGVVADAYAQSVLVSPIVEVRRGDLGRQNIVVGGEVTNPGLVEMTGPVGALEAVMLAGGFRNTAARGEVVVLRRQPGGRLMMRVVNVRQALNGRVDADQIQLRRHDLVFVPRSTVAEVTNFVEQYVYGVLPLDQALSFAIADAINDNN
ncbi:polysaccharide biosynthesis/export family protein [Maricaulis sp.]|uniref:polysaccharide biosynthesis/export family protein n=1 Tax=Maricaulis sp. TaxID=1486257 RepID=UPI00260CA1A2|nr:polysaccharide biosynthesis/export family protein [Maricaulis sp.]